MTGYAGLGAGLVAVGAGLGAAARYGAEVVHTRWRTKHGRTLDGRELPWATLSVNVVGSGLLGAAAGLAERGAIGHLALLAIGAGVAGGLTTFSTFAFDVVTLVRAGRGRAALGYVAASSVLGVATAAAAFRGVAG
jgi:CrcB protein